MDRVMTLQEIYQTAAVSLDTGRLQEAEYYCVEVLRVQPDCVPFLNLLGLVNQRAGDLTKALELHRLALIAEPENPESLNYLGEAFLAGQRISEAMESFSRAIQIQPDFSVAWSNLGYAQIQGKRYGEAVPSLEKAVEMDPQHPDFLNRLGIALRGNRQLKEAAEVYRRAIQICPESAKIWNNLGAALQSDNKADEALSAYRKALQLKPDYVSAWNNLGALYHSELKLEEALEAYRKAQELDPECFSAHFHEGQALLLGGDLIQGWVKHEYRWLTIGSSPQRSFAQPLWQGDVPVAGKTIILHSEQGCGDTIQFIRYAAVLADLGATVFVEVQAALVQLAAQAHGVHAAYPFGSSLPLSDFHCPLMTLPLSLRTTQDSIPSVVPYLEASPEAFEKWRECIPQTSSHKVGIVWRGNPEHENDINRSLDFENVRALFEVRGCEFINLQFGLNEIEAGYLQSRSNFRDPMPRVLDYNDTAALISHLDLIITVDTSVAHLAGALCKDVWILLPYSPDWRWLLAREDSPWYPSARLFRQSRPRDWSGVVADVERQLRLKGEAVKDSSCP